MKLPELVLLCALAVVLGLALCVLYFPCLLVAKLFKGAVRLTSHPSETPPLRVRRRLSR